MEAALMDISVSSDMVGKSVVTMPRSTHASLLKKNLSVLLVM